MGLTIPDYWGEQAIECDTGKVSDGYHTFDELYKHRHALFVTLANLITKTKAIASPAGYKSWKHDDGSMAYEGWFIAGLNLPGGQISYHLPAEYWPLVNLPHYDIPPKWDGHTPNDVINRLMEYAKSL
jgi:hypothetical protein